MTLSKNLIAAAAVTLLIGVPAADAQHRGGSGGGPRAVPRGSVPRSGGGAPRAGAPRAYSSPRGDTIAPRSYSSRPYSYGASREYGTESRGGVVAGRAVPRVFSSRGFRGAPVGFYRPYYSFRPRLSLGFGLRVGFPIIYPYSYGYYDPYYDPYGYSYGYSNPYPSPAYNDPYPSTSYPAYPSSAYPPSVYPQSAYPPASGSVSVQPGQDQADTGGVSFEIAPTTAQVFVDGSPVGTVAEFTPTTQPLGLTPGRHRIEIRAPGYQTMDFDADIVAGQVIPYQGTMQR
jgi:hypothetical protein